MDITSYLLGKKAGGGGGDYNWSTIGYSTTPEPIDTAYNHALEIKNNWDASITSRQGAFEKDLDLIVFPVVDMSNITSMRSIFNSCYRLACFPPQNLVDTSKVTTFYSAFSYCSALKSIDIDTSSATQIDSMFNNCTSLTNVGSFDFGNVTTAYMAFSGCSSLTSIGNLNLSKCYKLESMFKSCGKLVNIGTITGLATANNNSTATSMFDSCSLLVNAPSIDLSKIKNTSKMFYYCSKLENVPVYNLSTSTNVTNMFSNCSALTNDSLNNIMASLKTATNVTTKTLKNVGLSSAQATTCTSLSNWTDLSNAGWTTGYES